MKQPYGYFDKEPATYCITKKNLPTSWEYIYKNDRLLLVVDQNGPVKSQIDPPGGIMLFRREPLQTSSPWLVWLRCEDDKNKLFTNFFRPCLTALDPLEEPEQYHVRYSPDQACYTLCHQGVKTQTFFTIHPDKPAILMHFCVENTLEKDIRLTVFPTLRLYANAPQLAPWDQPEWYLKTTFFKEQTPAFLTQLLNMDAQPDKRRYVISTISDPMACDAEIYYEKFVGFGTFDNPQSVLLNGLRLSAKQAPGWGQTNLNYCAYAYPQINVLRYELSLKPKQSWQFVQTVCLVPNGPQGALPKRQAVQQAMALADAKEYEQARAALQQRYQRFFAKRNIDTGLSDFDDYVNHWLPLQQDWICSLDRGWPSGMRGSRDSANDFTAMAALDAQATRRAILLLLECQRSDGWFPRQYSAMGRTGKHDLRKHVDGGCWVIELIYEYLCWTKDFDILHQTVLWLDSDKASSVLSHLIQAMEYFLAPENLGQHGLCKIGEGDWNDAVNMAGLRGRGESVMVSCQTVIALTQMNQILTHLRRIGFPTDLNLTALADRYAQCKQDLINNLRQHAFNSEGYFNAVFNDDGKWIFSPHDPDGQRRFSGPANWYAIASGVADAAMTASILKYLDYLKCPEGYRLFYPPFGGVPIPTVGRIATGDQPPGVFENGTAYNQGAHGFLARALAAANHGDLLFDVIRYMLPYDQSIHPVQRTLTPPYAVVNTWLDVPGFEGRGGRTFLTGTIAMALRAVYSWMFGIQPTLTGLIIDPCLPKCLSHSQIRFEYQDKMFHLEIHNTAGGVIKVKLDGQPISNEVINPFTNRKAIELSNMLLSESLQRQISVHL